MEWKYTKDEKPPKNKTLLIYYNTRSAVSAIYPATNFNRVGLAIKPELDELTWVGLGEETYSILEPNILAWVEIEMPNKETREQ